MGNDDAGRSREVEEELEHNSDLYFLPFAAFTDPRLVGEVFLPVS